MTKDTNNLYKEINKVVEKIKVVKIIFRFRNKDENIYREKKGKVSSPKIV